MKCPNCNSEMKDGMAFCTHCGKPLPEKKTCPNCGTLIAVNATFCTNCGAKLSNTRVVKVQKKTTGLPKVSKKAILALIGVVLAVVVAVGIYEMFIKPTPQKIIKELYADYVFGDKKGSEDFLENNCTMRLLQRLQDNYEYECEDGRCYAIELFRTNTMDSAGGDAEDISKLNKITKLEDGWYRVEYIDMGWIGSTRIRFEEKAGKMLMDEVIDEIERNYDYVKKK